MHTYIKIILVLTCIFVSVYPSVHKQLIRPLFEAHIVLYVVYIYGPHWFFFLFILQENVIYINLGFVN